MKKIFVLTLLVLTLLLAVGCTAGPNDLRNTADIEGDTAGFWKGLWHGFISPFTFLVSLFKDTVSIYDVHNNGGWYNFGFLAGASAIFGGGSKGGSKVVSKRKK